MSSGKLLRQVYRAVLSFLSMTTASQVQQFSTTDLSTCKVGILSLPEEVVVCMSGINFLQA